jgi:hypothetical protein
MAFLRLLETWKRTSFTAYALDGAIVVYSDMAEP